MTRDREFLLHGPFTGPAFTPKPPASIRLRTLSRIYGIIAALIGCGVILAAAANWGW